MLLKCLISDDEPLAHRLLENYCARLTSFQVVGNAYDAFETLDFLNQNQVDILFLDINMPDFSGLEMLRTLASPPFVILTTAYSEHSLEAYDLGVIDYLLKPISFERFLKATNRITQFKQVNLPSNTEIPSQNNTITDDFLMIKSGSTRHKIVINEILYVKAYGNFSKIITINQTVTAALTMKFMETTLPENQFVRVHKSYIVAIAKIEKIEKQTLFIQKTALPIGAAYKLLLEKKIKTAL